MGQGWPAVEMQIGSVKFDATDFVFRVAVGRKTFKRSPQTLGSKKAVPIRIIPPPAKGSPARVARGTGRN
jgi:hypothetical protein